MSLCKYFERGSENIRYDLSSLQQVDAQPNPDCCTHDKSDYKVPAFGGVKCKGDIAKCVIPIESR